jgi:hypothetical protein
MHCRVRWTRLRPKTSRRGPRLSAGNWIESAARWRTSWNLRARPRGACRHRKQALAFQTHVNSGGRVFGTAGIELQVRFCRQYGPGVRIEARRFAWCRRPIRGAFRLDGATSLKYPRTISVATGAATSAAKATMFDDDGEGEARLPAKSDRGGASPLVPFAAERRAALDGVAHLLLIWVVGGKRVVLADRVKISEPRCAL